MKIEMKKFGKLLISRPAGKEAFAAAKAYIFKDADSKEIVLDFEGVDVLSPSWADEFITGIKEQYKGTVVKYLNTDNQSVKATLQIIAKNAV